jgi:uncharacterized phage-associated protein
MVKGGTMFNDRKAAHMAAVLLQKAGGSLNVLKLTKLLYLAERESLDRYGLPISDDCMVSMPRGPVLSNTLDLTNGYALSQDWEYWIEDREQHQVKLKRPFAQQDLDSLSEAALSALDAVWGRFGHMDQWQLVKFTHDECAEWEDPGRSSFPIPAKRVFIALGKTRHEADILNRELLAQKGFDSLFAEDGA